MAYGFENATRYARRGRAVVDALFARIVPVFGDSGATLDKVAIPACPLDISSL
jgi:hypothetical protein